MRSWSGYSVHLSVQHFGVRHVNGSLFHLTPSNDPAAVAPVVGPVDPPPDKPTMEFLQINIPKMKPQAESAEFAAIWLHGDAPFTYQPHGATVNDPLLNIANPLFSQPHTSWTDVHCCQTCKDTRRPVYNKFRKVHMAWGKYSVIFTKTRTINC